MEQKLLLICNESVCTKIVPNGSSKNLKANTKRTVQVVTGSSGPSASLYSKKTNTSFLFK